MTKFTLYDSRHEVPEQFGRNKRQKTVRLHDKFQSIPLHERSDQLPSSATAINNGLDYVPNMKSFDSTIRIGESEFKYQLAASNFRGARIIRPDTYNYRHSKKGNIELASKRFLVDEDHYLNTKNESRFGLHGINKQSRTMFRKQDPNTVGSTNHTRYAGLERHKLPEFYPRLPDSVPEHMVETNVPNRDTFRFNEKTVEDVPQVFPDMGF